MADSSNISIHFAFPDGALRYDCSGCDQRCCKLGGLVVFPAERDQILRMHPALELVSPADGGSIAVFATARSGCWFLDDDRCRLLASDEREMNQAHTPPRPRACTLFPFNIFGVFDDHLVVAPNAVCPLQIDVQRGIRHEEVIAQLGALGAAGAPPEEQRPADPPGSIVLERVIRDACQATLGEDNPFSLLAFCEVAGEAFVRDSTRGLETIDLSNLADRAAKLAAEISDLAAVLAVPSPSKAAFARVAAMLAAWTPSLRIFAFSGVPLAHLARAQLVLTLYFAHWADLAPHRPLLAQALMQLVSSLAPSIAALSCDGRMEVRAQLQRMPADSLERAARLRKIAALAWGGAT